MRISALLCAVAACASGGRGGAPLVPPGKPEAFELRDLAGVSDAVDVRKLPRAPKQPYVPVAGGRAWFVAPGASGGGRSPEDPDDLWARVSGASDGDVIWLKGGTYKVGRTDDEFALRVRADGVVLAAWPGQRAVLEPADEAITYGIELGGDNVVVDGLELRGFNSGGIYVGRLRSTQRNVTIARVKIDGGQDGIRSVVRGGRSKQPLVDGLLLYDVAITNAGIGFNCGEGPCSNVRLERVRVDGGDPDASGEGGSAADAVAFEAGDNVAIVDSEVKGVGADGYDLKVTRVLLLSSAVRGVGRNGIKLWYGGDLVNCLVHGTGADAAVVFDRGGHYRVVHTTVARHGRRRDAYSLTMAYDHPRQKGRLEITNSIFWGNAGPVWVSGATELVIRSSLFSGSRGGVEIVWAQKEERKLGPGQARAAGDGVLFGVDPQFRDPDAGDFRLRPQSPARDAGARDRRLPPHDLEGTPRAVGKGPDLGAYELVVKADAG